MSIKWIFFVALFLFISDFGFCQNHEVELKYRFGLATENFQMSEPGPYTSYNHYKTRSLNDQGIVLNYKYQIWKRARLFLSGGVDFSKSKHFQRINQDLGGRNIDNIIISKKRYTFHLGIHKQFNFYNDKVILDLGCDVIRRNYGSKIDNYSIDFKRSEHFDWIEYRYSYTAFYDDEHYGSGALDGRKKLNLEWSLTAKYEIYKNLYLDIGFSYSRQNIFFYNYNFDMLYYLGGSTTPTGSYSFLGTFGSTPENVYAINEDFFYLNLGLSYKFNWNNKK